MTLVIGGANQVSAFLVPALLSSGAQVTVLSRTARPPWIADHPSLQWRRDTTTLPEPHEELYYLAPLGLIDQFHSLLVDGVRLVAFSSTSAFTKADSTDSAEQQVAATLNAGEIAVQRAAAATGARWTLLRPTLIYGAGLDANLTRVARFVDRWRYFPLVGSGSGLRQPVHACDLAATAMRAAAPAAPGHACYTLAGGTTLSYRDMIAAVFLSLHRKPRLVTIPHGLLPLAVGIARRLPRWRDLTPAMFDRMNRDLAFDDTPARTDLGHDPRAFAPTATTWQRLDLREPEKT